MRTFKDASTRGDWFVDYWFGGKRIRINAGGSKEAAGKLRTRIETEINAGKHDPAALRASLRGEGAADSMSVEQLFDAYFARPSSYKTDYYRELAKPVRAAVGTAAITALDGNQFERYLHERQAVTCEDGSRRVADDTIRREVETLRKALRWARGKGIATGTAIQAYEDWEKPKAKRGTGGIVVVSPDQERVIFERVTAWAADIIEWAIYSGMRQAEILGMRWPDIDKGRAIIGVLSGKTAHHRAVPLDLSARLRAILARRPRHTMTDLVFCERDGSPINPKRVQDAVRSAFKAAGLPGRGALMNAFRHTMATRIMATGRVSMFELSRWMGNSVAVCERHYAAYVPDSFKRAAGIMDVVEIPDSNRTASGA